MMSIFSDGVSKACAESLEKSILSKSSRILHEHGERKLSAILSESSFLKSLDFLQILFSKYQGLLRQFCTLNPSLKLPQMDQKRFAETIYAEFPDQKGLILESIQSGLEASCYLENAAELFLNPQAFD